MLGLVIAALGGIDVTFYFWPFRYRQVHPLLESTFRSRIDVKHYHRTYFPHPGFVAEGMTFYHRGDTSIPPLATLDRMTVLGTWTGLILHPHTLYEMRLDGLHVQIPPAGTVARGMDFGGGVLSASQMKMDFQTIVADSTVLDIMRSNKPPLRFQFSALQIHDVRAQRPFSFFARVAIPGPQGIVSANGSLGPFQNGDYGATHVSGTFSLSGADLHRVSELAGHVAARGQFSGTLSAVDVRGSAAIPDFRVADAHTEPLDVAYHVTVQGSKGDVKIHSAQVRIRQSTIFASGAVSGSPKQVQVALSTQDSHLEQLLDLIESREPSVAGYVTFQANAHFQEGSEPFLKRLELQGQVSIHQVRFVQQHTREEMDAFSARVRKGTPQEPNASHGGDDVQVAAAAWSHTTFHDGMAQFPDIHVTLPGAQAQLHGTFNLLNTRVHLTGNAELQRNLSHAVTGWKSVLLKPLAPFFKHKNAGALVPVAVTGTASDPKIQGNLLHDK